MIKALASLVGGFVLWAVVGYWTQSIVAAAVCLLVGIAAFVHFTCEATRP